MTTAVAAKPRTITYFEMSGTSSEVKLTLTKPSVKAIQGCIDVLKALSKAHDIFPLAPLHVAGLESFLKNPTSPQTIMDGDAE